MKDWRELAECRDEDTDWWFSHLLGDQQRAKAFCFGCQVRDHCLEYAFEKGEWDGIWGGLDPDERKKLARKLKKTRHGTLTGYTTDNCRCEHCKEEMIEYDRSHRPRQTA